MQSGENTNDVVSDVIKPLTFAMRASVTFTFTKKKVNVFFIIVLTFFVALTQLQVD